MSPMIGYNPKQGKCKVIMPHVLIVGMTESGKTTYAVGLCDAYRKQGIKTVVLDPLLDKRWNADFITDNTQIFLEVISSPETWGCAVFIDESSESMDKYDRDHSQWIATRGRHKGHNAHFICQKITQIAPVVRDQCTYLVMFQCGPNSRKQLSEEWNKPEIADFDLQKGHFINVPRFGDIQKGEVF